jgi:oligopeptide transport system substrate-binding protein
MTRARFALLSFAVLLATAGCEGDNTAACPPGKLCMQAGNNADPVSLDPAKTSGTWESVIMGDLFLGLATDDAAGKVIPGLAESWTTSPDGLTWTFKLRPMVWSDGTPITADDVVFSFRRVQDPKTASEYAYLHYMIRNAQAVNEGKAPLSAMGVRAPDPRTVVIELEHPAPYLPQLLKHQTSFPVPKHVVQKWGDQWTQPEHYVSSGPYKLVSWRLGDRIRLAKNDRFYEAAKVCLDEVVYYPTTDKVSGERRVLSGELDLNGDIQSNRVPYLMSQPKARPYVRISPYLGNAYLSFNTHSPKFKDPRVRRALNMAIDREFIVEKLRRGGERPAYGFVPPGVTNYPGGVKVDWAGMSFEQRQAEARRLLAAAGYGPSNPLKLELTHRGIDHGTIFPSIQADWKAIGVQTTLAGYESQIAYQAYRSRDFEVGDMGWVADYDDALTFLALHESAAGSQNYSDYKNPAYDALLNEANNEADAGERAALLMRAEKILIEDSTVVPLFFLVTKNLVNPSVSGWVDNIGDEHRKRWLCFKDAAARRGGRG